MARWKAVRDIVSFALGAFIAVHEVVVRTSARWEVLAFAGVLMGLAPFLRGIEIARNGGRADG